MSRAICPLCFLLSLVSISIIAGCGKSGPSASPELIAKYRTQLTMADEPDGGQLVSDVRAALLGEDEASEEHIHTEGDGHDHAHDQEGEHAEEAHAEGEGEHAEEVHEEHAGEDDKLATEAAVGEEHDSEAEADHEEHEHADDDEHADDGEDEHAGHDDDEHAGHDDDEHAGHDEDEHAGHDEDEHAGHAHEEGDEHAHEVVKATEAMEVVLVGRVGGLANPWKETQPDFPFAKNKAVFFLADPLAVVENEEAGGHVHEPGEECAFCEANAADSSNMLAMVRFIDEKGDVLPMDVRDLFDDVKVTDTVVVRGSARVVEGGMMVVDATGLYIRR